MMNYSYNDIRTYADFLYKLSGKELALLASASGFLLSQNLNANQINSIGNFLEAVGQIMLCIGAQEQLRNSPNQYNSK